MAAESFVYGTAKALTSNGFTAPSGYAFVGWATSVANATAGIVQYTNGQSVTNPNGITSGSTNLYAIWRRAITFYSGSNKATTTAVYQYYNGSTSAGANITTPSATTCTDISGWTELGWRDDTTAGAQEYNFSASINPAVTVYYAAYSRTATFYHGYNKAANTTATQYYNSNNIYAVTTPTAATCTDITYWTELGWRADTTASTASYGFNASCNSSSNVFYAVYSQTPVMSYAGNGNTGGSTSNTNGTTRYLNSGNTTLSSANATWTLANNGFTKTGYSFNGWDLGAAGVSYSVAVAYNASPNKTAIAQWSANPYTLTANANGGTIPTTTGWTIASGNATATKSVNYNATYGTLPTPTRSGYHFVGWYTATSGGSAVSSSTTMTSTSGATIYARWNQDITIPT